MFTILWQKPGPKDISTICFTSGTTGVPKGVILTHGNMIATTVMFFHVKRFAMVPSQVLLSFLPLAHMYERICENAAIAIGCRIGYYSGDVRNLLDDMQALRPTVVAMVPRVLDRIYDRQLITVSEQTFLRQYFCNETLADKLVFQKIRQKFGGNLLLIFTGAAPVSQEVLQFSRVVLGCSIVEGYGQTECVAACTATVEADFTAGHVGTPMLNTAVKLVDASEIGYFAKNNAGEICVRGPSVFKGYYKDEAATREALDGSGWLHTGDIGSWNKNGTLKIIDRKKFIFKLQQGEYIAPEKIENIFIRSQYVTQAFVYGESLKCSLIAIVVPDDQVWLDCGLKFMLRKLAAESFSMNNASLSDICSNVNIKRHVMNDMNSIGRRNGLFSFECVKDIYLTVEPFTVENGLLTPTFKNRRNNFKKQYSSVIADMYSKLK
ncbi:unnamed protein product [Enterobius vermicularis]|uniref:long-chain-fatty-acid--CoA ligase n=1 Tax=Enterobius vermicularis TaxID=51028 RepID=A0A0N4V7P2_ENTVE|nr:unnamed protein product [Enterobius vermicularis]